MKLKGFLKSGQSFVRSPSLHSVKQSVRGKKKKREGAEQWVKGFGSGCFFLVKEGDVDKATSPSVHSPAVPRGLKGFTEGKQLFDFPELALKSTAVSHTPSIVRLRPDNPFQHLLNIIKYICAAWSYFGNGFAFLKKKQQEIVCQQKFFSKTACLLGPTSEATSSYWPFFVLLSN